MFSFLRHNKSASAPDVPEISRLLSEGKVLLVDVRETAEAMANGIAEGARLIPLSLLPLKADPSQPGCELAQGLPVVVYCAAGGRASRAADLLGRFGYGEVANLGGLSDWAAGGGKVVAFKG